MNNEHTIFFPAGDTDLNYIAQAARIAVNTNRSLRIHYDNGAIKVKVGEGMWSPSMFGEDDPTADSNVIRFPLERRFDV